MKAKKIIGFTAGVLLLGAILSPLWLGPAVRQIIQRVGTQALGTPVLIHHLSINPITGTLHLDGFSIANPEPFRTPHAVTVDRLDISIEMASLFSPIITIQQVRIENAHVILEQNETSNNIAAFTQNLLKFSGDAPPKPIKESKKEPPIVMIQSLEIIGTQLLLAHTADPSLDFGAGLEWLSLSMTNGMIQLKEFQLDNPAGFSATNLAHLSTIEVALAPASLFSDQIIINQIVIDSPELNIEQNEYSGNLTELHKFIQRFIPVATERPLPKTSPAPAPSSLTELPVLLESFMVTNLAINAILSPLDPMAAAKHLKKLNPMAYIHSEESTNETTQIEEITLVSFDQLRIEPPSGTAQLLNLHIGNLSDFSNEHLLKLDRIHLTLDPNTLLSDTLLIKKIQVDTPLVVYERKIKTDNIKALQTSITGAISIAEKREDQPWEENEEPQGAEETQGQKVIIEHLIVQDGTVRAKISKLPTAPLPLPTIEMKDIGKKEGGASLSEASTRIFTAFYDSIVGVATDSFGSMTESLGGLIGFGEEEETEEEIEERPDSEKKKKHRRRVFQR